MISTILKIALAIFKALVILTLLSSIAKFFSDTFVQGLRGAAANIPRNISTALLRLFSDMMKLIVKSLAYTFKMPFIVLLAILDGFIALMWRVLPFLEPFDPPKVSNLVFR